jgi:hypothetical protein
MKISEFHHGFRANRPVERPAEPVPFELSRLKLGQQIDDFVGVPVGEPFFSEALHTILKWVAEHPGHRYVTRAFDLGSRAWIPHPAGDWTMAEATSRMGVVLEIENPGVIR